MAATSNVMGFPKSLADMKRSALSGASMINGSWTYKSIPEIESANAELGGAAIVVDNASNVSGENNSHPSDQVVVMAKRLASGAVYRQKIANFLSNAGLGNSAEVEHHSGLEVSKVAELDELKDALKTSGVTQNISDMLTTDAHILLSKIEEYLTAEAKNAVNKNTVDGLSLNTTEGGVVGSLGDSMESNLGSKSEPKIGVGYVGTTFNPYVAHIENGNLSVGVDIASAQKVHQELFEKSATDRNLSLIGVDADMLRTMSENPANITDFYASKAASIINAEVAGLFNKGLLNNKDNKSRSSEVTNGSSTFVHSDNFGIETYASNFAKLKLAQKNKIDVSFSYSDKSAEHGRDVSSQKIQVNNLTNNELSDVAYNLGSKNKINYSPKISYSYMDALSNNNPVENAASVSPSSLNKAVGQAIHNLHNLQKAGADVAKTSVNTSSAGRSGQLGTETGVMVAPELDLAPRATMVITPDSEKIVKIREEVELKKQEKSTPIHATADTSHIVEIKPIHDVKSGYSKDGYSKEAVESLEFFNKNLNTIGEKNAVFGANSVDEQNIRQVLGKIYNGNPDDVKIVYAAPPDPTLASSPYAVSVEKGKQPVLFVNVDGMDHINRMVATINGNDKFVATPGLIESSKHYANYQNNNFPAAALNHEVGHLNMFKELENSKTSVFGTIVGDILQSSGAGHAAQTNKAAVFMEGVGDAYTTLLAIKEGDTSGVRALHGMRGATNNEVTDAIPKDPIHDTREVNKAVMDKYTAQQLSNVNNNDLIKIAIYEATASTHPEKAKQYNLQKGVDKIFEESAKAENTLGSHVVVPEIPAKSAAVTTFKHDAAAPHFDATGTRDASHPDNNNLGSSAAVNRLIESRMKDEATAQPQRPQQMVFRPPNTNNN